MRYTITIEVEAEEGDVDATDMRHAVAGMLDRCGLRKAERVEVREGSDHTAAILVRALARADEARAVAAAGVTRLASFTDNARAGLVQSVDPRENMRADYIAAKMTALVGAEAREEGYRAAVADLLGALGAGA